MKYFLFTALIVLAISNIIFSQTYISPIGGFASSKVESKYFHESGYDNIIPLEKGYSNGSPQIGLSIKQRLSKKLELKLRTNFSHKQIPATINSIVEIKGFEFNYYQTDLTVQYYVLPGIYIGSGVSYNQLQKIKSIVKLNGDLYKSNESGLIFSVGKMFNKLNVELFFYKGLSEIEIRHFDLYLKPISSFGIILSYDIKILSKIGKKVNCPEF